MSIQSKSEESWDADIGLLAHELRQEVSAVLHQVELLKIASIDEATRRRSLDAIEANAEKLMSFVDDLTRLDRLTRGEVTATCREVDIGELIAGSGQDRARPLCCPVQHDGSSEVLSVYTDPIVVDQVIAGLLGRFDGIDVDGAVNAWALRTDDKFIDVIFTAERERPSGSVEFRSATLEDGLDLYVARRTAELAGADVGVQRSGRHDCYLLRLPDAAPVNAD